VALSTLSPCSATAFTPTGSPPVPFLSSTITFHLTCACLYPPLHVPYPHSQCLGIVSASSLSLHIPHNHIQIPCYPFCSFPFGPYSKFHNPSPRSIPSPMLHNSIPTSFFFPYVHLSLPHNRKPPSRCPSITIPLCPITTFPLLCIHPCIALFAHKTSSPPP
jgi:hypothetical protein